MIVFVFCFMVKEEREGKRGIFFLDRSDFERCNLQYLKTGVGLSIVMGMGSRLNIHLKLDCF